MNLPMVFKVTSFKNPMMIEGEIEDLAFYFYEYRTKWNISIEDGDTQYIYHGTSKLKYSEHVPVGIAKILTVVKAHKDKEESPTHF